MSGVSGRSMEHVILVCVMYVVSEKIERGRARTELMSLIKIFGEHADSDLKVFFSFGFAVPHIPR